MSASTSVGALLCTTCSRCDMSSDALTSSSPSRRHWRFCSLSSASVCPILAHAQTRSIQHAYLFQHVDVSLAVDGGDLCEGRGPEVSQVDELHVHQSA